jgi:O-antigen ligase
MLLRAEKRRDYLLIGLIALGMGYPIGRMVVPSFVQLGLLVPYLLLGIWWIWRSRQAPSYLASPLAWPLVGLALSLSLSSLTAYAPFSAVLAMLFHWGAVAILLFLSCDLLAHGVSPRLFLSALLLSSSLALGAGAWQMAGWLLGWWQLWGPGQELLPVAFRQNLVGTHPNQAAMLFYLGLPAAIMAWWQARRWWQQIIWALWVLIEVLLIFATGSRGGWLALAALSGLSVAYLLWQAWQAKAWRRFVATISISLSYGLLFAGLVWASLGQIAAQRGGSVVGGTGRSLFWNYALQIGQDHPILGIGPTGYSHFFMANESSSRNFHASHAHNMLLTVLSEFGLFGIIALGISILAMLMIGWRAWRQQASGSPERLLLVAVASSALGLLVHGLVEVPVPQISGMLLYLIATGLTLGGAWQLKPAKTLSWRGFQMPYLYLLLPSLALAALALSSFVSWQESRTNALVSQANQRLSVGDPRSALELFESAYRIDPDASSALSGLAVALATMAEQDPELIDAAIEALTLADQQNIADFYALPNRAALLLAAGRDQEAAKLLKDLIAQDHSNWGLPYLLLAQQPNLSEAERQSYWQEALDRQASLALTSACRSDRICSRLALPESVDADLKSIVEQANLKPSEQIKALEASAQKWLSVDLWASAALIAQYSSDDHAEQRALRAAQDQARMVGYRQTRLLGLALLRNALARDDHNAMRSLAYRWGKVDNTIVPQLARLLAEPIDLALIQAAGEAAERLDDAILLEQVQTYRGLLKQAK